MKRYISVILAFVFIAAMAVAAHAAANIDIFGGTINGQNLFEMNSDQVQAVLGRADNAETERSIGTTGVYFGEKLFYPDQGLQFQFQHSAIDKKKRCVLIKIYLGKESDGATRFNPFEGNLSGGINGDWNSKKVMTAFASYKPTDRLSKIKAGASDAMKKAYAGIDINRPSYNIAILYNPGTTILESISLMSHNLKYKK